MHAHTQTEGERRWRQWKQKREKEIVDGIFCQKYKISYYWFGIFQCEVFELPIRQSFLSHSVLRDFLSVTDKLEVYTCSSEAWKKYEVVHCTSFILMSNEKHCGLAVNKAATYFFISAV